MFSHAARKWMSLGVLLGCGLVFVGHSYAMESCVQALKKMPGTKSSEQITALCSHAQTLSNCQSRQSRSIFHFNYPGSLKKPLNILVFALIHGDEPTSGSLARDWALRLQSIKDARHNWRVVPVLNPDGFEAKTRTNANGVDLNRNFATKNWKVDAMTYWKKKVASDPRRFPGKEPNEPEVVCATSHIDDFKPHFIISIHSPYGVLDFDGPRMKKFPPAGGLPWKSLGHYPGSMGRYMWAERKVPVLTVELKGSFETLNSMSSEKLQDAIGSLVLSF